jgi:hypothetical protein
MKTKITVLVLTPFSSVPFSVTKNFGDDEEILENGLRSTIRQKIIHINIPALRYNKSAVSSKIELDIWRRHGIMKTEMDLS